MGHIGVSCTRDAGNLDREKNKEKETVKLSAMAPETQYEQFNGKQEIKIND